MNVFELTDWTHYDRNTMDLGTENTLAKYLNMYTTYSSI